MAPGGYLLLKVCCGHVCPKNLSKALQPVPCRLPERRRWHLTGHLMELKYAFKLDLNHFGKTNVYALLEVGLELPE